MPSRSTVSHAMECSGFSNISPASFTGETCFLHHPLYLLNGRTLSVRPPPSSVLAVRAFDVQGPDQQWSPNTLFPHGSNSPFVNHLSNTSPPGSTPLAARSPKSRTLQRPSSPTTSSTDHHSRRRSQRQLRGGNPNRHSAATITVHAFAVRDFEPAVLRWWWRTWAWWVSPPVTSHVGSVDG